MSKHNHDHETPAKHLRRRLMRWYKFLLHIPISLDDVSVVQMRERGGTSYEARRNTTSGWSVYRIYDVKYDKKTPQSMHETLGVDLTLESALDLLQQKSPEGMGRNFNSYNHPLQVAKLIRHEFPATPA